MKTRQSRGGLGLFAGLCLLSGAGCQTSTAPEAQEAAGVVERLRAHRMNTRQAGATPHAVLPPSGGARVERTQGGLTVKPRSAHVVLPDVAQRAFRMKDMASGMTLDVALEGAGPAKAEVVDGYVVYPDAYPGHADVVHRFTPDGTEDYLSFERAPSQPEVRYGLTLGAGSMGLRLVADTLEVLDGSGAPRLRMAPPYLVGADGRVTPAHVSVEGCAVDTRASAPWQRPVTAPGSRQCQVRVAWNAEAVEYPAVLDPVWVTTGSLTQPRRAHTTTLLADGRVLAVGGSDTLGNLQASAELYDPVTGTWATTGSLQTGRQYHSATALGSGQVLVAGGTTGAPGYENLATVERYDPITGTWSSASPMSTVRAHHQAVLLDDGHVLAMGGVDSTSYPLSSAELYDPATDTWAPTGSLTRLRQGHGAVRLADGRVLTFGGGGYTDSANTAELYAPTTGTWTSTSAMTSWQSRPLGVLLSDGRVLVTDPSQYQPQAEVYDPATDTWSTTAAPTHVRYEATAHGLPDGRVLLVGGMSGTSGPQETDTTEVYDPFTGTWSFGATLNTGRQQHASSVLQDGRVLVAGGIATEGYGILASTEVLQLDLDDVTAPIASLTAPSEGATVEGEVTLTADATDDYGVKRVDFHDGATLIGTARTAPYSIVWYTRWSAANGPHTLTARAYDPSGNVSESSSVSVLVNNDVTPPTATLTAPVEGGTHQGVMTLSADASDDRGVVNRVEFWDGRKQLGVVTSAPYTMSWDLTDVPGGPHTVIAKAYDAAGNEGTSSASIIVSQPGTASYDNTLRVPLCATAGALCDSGSYLTGRGTLEPEPHQPNTLQDSCADSSDIAYYDMSLDRIRISTTDGGPMQTGKQVRVEVTVKARPYYYSSEQLDLYYAADANQPVWTYLATLGPGSSGTRTLTTFYTLPAGTRQAVRGHYRYLGSTSTCGSGGYDDHDDLAFAVDNETTPPTVSLTSPGSGATVSGTTTLSATASDNLGVTRVEFYLGTTLLGADTTSPYSLSWNTAGVANGAYSLQARAYDAAGNVGQSTTVSINVFNDTTAPTVSLTSPGAGATVSGTTTLSASATDNVAVTRVEFYRGTTLLGTDTAYPYSLAWSTTSVANGAYTLQARAYDAAGNLGQSATVSVTVANDTTAPTASLTSPGAGATVSGTTTLSATASDNVGVSRVEFYRGTTLLGTDTTSPYSLSWNTAGVANGTYSLLAKAYDAAGNVGQSAQVQVTVSNTTPGMAAYDATLGAPRCTDPGASCDSGTLLNGRATLGPEANAPNTADTCTDGTSGTYHSDESLDRLKVSTLDGTPLAAGRSVRIDATVWAYSGYSSDSLDLYFAPDASAPVWTYVGTMKATAAGSHVLSTTYTLPSGSTPRAAVRGVFRFNGSASSCEGGAYTDVDDLVFSVQ